MAMGDDAACAGLRLAGDSATCSCGGGECGGERPALCGVAPRVVSRARARCGLRLRCSEGIEIESRSATAVAMAEGVEGSRSSGEATRRSAVLGAVLMRPSSHAARALLRRRAGLHSGRGALLPPRVHLLALGGPLEFALGGGEHGAKMLCLAR